MSNDGCKNVGNKENIHDNCKRIGTAVDENNKIEEQRAYATIGRVYLTKAQSEINAPHKTDNLAKCIKNAEKHFLKSLLICKR